VSKFFIISYQALGLKKKYVLFAVLYGISSLVVPLTTQYLVNQLSLSAIFINTLTFVIVLTILLTLSQLFKYCQSILSEYIQREIFVTEAQKWKAFNITEKAPYFFEVHNSMKTFSSSLSQIIELGLLLFFGLIVVLTFHPAFLVLLILLGTTMFLIFQRWPSAIKASLEESNHKYKLFRLKAQGKEFNEEDLTNFLSARDKHFSFVKRNTIIVAWMFVIGHLYLIGVGIYLIQVEQLSLGQLVSAEIILSGILGSLTRFPKTLEDLYDYETSKYKLKYALEGEGIP
jgi:hypothetical protein